MTAVASRYFRGVTRTVISVGFYTRSLALVADAFHYLNDLIGFIIALVAVQVSERKTPPADLSFGWARAQLLGAFFNGAFLLALGLSIALQSIERFITIEHKHGMDLGIFAVLLHVIGDAINNIGVVISAVIIWFVKSPNRFYADPAVSMWIAIMIFLSALPLTKRSGKILLQSAPLGVKIEDVKHDLEAIPGVLGVHELHVWRLDQKKAIASAHVRVSDPDIASFMEKAKIFSECLHAYGIHSATLQPELASPAERLEDTPGASEGVTLAMASATSTARPSKEKCRVPCGSLCEELKCCN
ncbi:hypothetical protein GGP41_008158 [Bipolaris sorokiniana]|uniref:Cation efflux protein cytoplasmic domain-containing protein n=1 Tax=Cochliobolus sativus TaxID=45130 RepID=A0A8H5ZR59_COCSA|nr:hypothetical protein GGP41_008158 [Bipolaris sorokiniana]